MRTRSVALVLVVALLTCAALAACATQPPVSYVDARTIVTNNGKTDIEGGIGNGDAKSKSGADSTQNPQTSATANVPVGPGAVRTPSIPPVLPPSETPAAPLPTKTEVPK